jgi:hypothetical protein
LETIKITVFYIIVFIHPSAYTSVLHIIELPYAPNRVRTSGNTDAHRVLLQSFHRGNFQSPIFFSHSGVDKINLKNLIIDILKNLFEVGLCPKVVCDQGTNNQSTLKSLNIS